MGFRDYKQFGKGEYYHIYNRGNAGDDIFIDLEDYWFFLQRLRLNLYPEESFKFRIRQLPANSFSIIAYCLMPNHFHFLLRQNSNIPTSKLVTKICSSYSKYFNKKYKRVGHVFQDQFKQVIISDDSYLLWLSAYIHQNPNVAGIIKNPEEYLWSSYKYYLENKGYLSCDNKVVMDQFRSVAEYKKFTNDSLRKIREGKNLKYVVLD